MKPIACYCCYCLSALTNRNVLKEKHFMDPLTGHAMFAACTEMNSTGRYQAKRTAASTWVIKCLIMFHLELTLSIILSTAFMNNSFLPPSDLWRAKNLLLVVWQSSTQDGQKRQMKTMSAMFDHPDELFQITIHPSNDNFSFRRLLICQPLYIGQLLLLPFF